MEDALVAYGQNGEPVRPEQGFPLRLVAPGWQGINNVKWLRRIDLVDEPYLGMMESTKYPTLKLDGKSRWFELELGPKSVITKPCGGQHLPGTGFYEITGLAWSGGGAIRRVEVSVDGGRTWKDAQLFDPIAQSAHAILNSLDVERRGSCAPIALHGRSGRRAAIAGGSRQNARVRPGVFSNTDRQRGRLQCHPALESKSRWQHSKWIVPELVKYRGADEHEAVESQRFFEGRRSAGWISRAGAAANVLPLAAQPALERIDELHLYGERSRFVNSVREGSINNPEQRIEK